MSARRLLEIARRAGLQLTLAPDGGIDFEADRPPPPELLAELRAHRAEIAAILAAERDLGRAARALAEVEPDPAPCEAIPPKPADPVGPILELLETGELDAAREVLADAARVWLDPWTWRELEALAFADPTRCRRALEAVLARNPRALDRLLDGAEAEPGDRRAAA